MNMFKCIWVKIKQRRRVVDEYRFTHADVIGSLVEFFSPMFKAVSIHPNGSIKIKEYNVKIKCEILKRSFLNGNYLLKQHRKGDYFFIKGKEAKDRLYLIFVKNDYEKFSDDQRLKNHKHVITALLKHQYSGNMVESIPTEVCGLSQYPQVIEAIGVFEGTDVIVFENPIRVKQDDIIKQVESKAIMKNKILNIEANE